MIKIDFSGKGNQSLEIGKKDVIPPTGDKEAVRGPAAAAASAVEVAQESDAPQNVGGPDSSARVNKCMSIRHDTWQQRAPV